MSLRTNSTGSLAEPRPVAVPFSRRRALAFMLGGSALAVSGALRAERNRSMNRAFDAGLTVKFPLAELPLTMGDWVGREEAMDPIIAEVAGCSDNVQRTFINSKTGAVMNVFVLFGPGRAVLHHPPENCYVNGLGFAIDSSQNREIPRGDSGPPARFRVLTCTRGKGAELKRVQVYYSWRLHGLWTPDPGPYKNIERVPDVYKIQVDRSLSPVEAPDASDVVENELGRKGSTLGRPCEDLIALLVPVFEARMAQASGAHPKSN